MKSGESIMKPEVKKIILSLFALIAAGVAPNLFVIAEAGYASLSDLAVEFLIPSILFLTLIIVVSWFTEERQLTRQIKNGIMAGIIGTIGLEIIRETGFRLGGMPGELPELMGVLLLNRFADGPSLISNVAGWSYHFWNGASFGIIYSIIAGKGKLWIGTFYGIVIGIGFMISPVVVALGVGEFGTDFGWGFPVIVTLAHIAFGTILGWYVFRKNSDGTSIFANVKGLFAQKRNSAL
jgi:hypothetical protein